MPRQPPQTTSEPSESELVTEYRAAVAMLYGWAAVLAHLDLPKLLNDIARADAIGPIIDPTLYRDRAGAMRADRQVIEAALKLREIGIRMSGQGPGLQAH